MSEKGVLITSTPSKSSQFLFLLFFLQSSRSSRTEIFENKILTRPPRKTQNCPVRETPKKQTCLVRPTFGKIALLNRRPTRHTLV